MWNVQIVLVIVIKVVLDLKFFDIPQRSSALFSSGTFQIHCMRVAIGNLFNFVSPLERRSYDFLLFAYYRML